MSGPSPRRLVRPSVSRLASGAGPSLANQSLVTISSPDLGATYLQASRPAPSSATPSTSALSPAGLSARDALARKASFNQLTSNSLAALPDASVAYRLGLGLGTVDDDEPSSPPAMEPVTPAGPRASGSDGAIDVGDSVDVPGGMHGTVKFIGSVKGKKGVFAGVELSRAFAPRGKNDGDVEG